MADTSDDIGPVLVSNALARFIPEEDSQTLPIACRFVPQDQWLVSHIDTSWKIKDIKNWILSKCNAWGTTVPQPPRFRPASPVTFAASRRSSIESTLVDTDDGEDDWDVFANDVAGARQDVTGSDKFSAGRPSFNSAEDMQPPIVPESVTLKYALYSYSCGHLLEDEASLSWYKLRPFELLEMHRMNGVISLPRNSLLSYIEPYFEATVMVSEGATSRKSRKAKNGRISEEKNAAWLVRWAFVRNGVLNLCKDRSCMPTHRFPIHALCTIRGAEALQQSLPGPNQFVVCAKFKLPAPTIAESDDNIRHQRHRAPPKPPKTSTWVVLDMLEANSYDNFLRVLHRLAPCILQTSFVPTVSVPKTPLPSPTDSASSPDGPNFVGFGVRYPEWRIALVERARKAGLGDVGPAMAHYLYGSEDSTQQNHVLRRQASTLSGLRLNMHRRAETSMSASLDISLSMSDNTWFGDEDDDDDDADDMDSEVEWEGWVRDVSRRAQEHRSTVTTCLPTPSPSPGPRPLSPNPPDYSSYSFDTPSSPTSTSSHSSDVDSSPSGSRTRTLSFAPDPRKVITSAFVSVGQPARTRSRSSTVTAATVKSSRSGASSSSMSTSFVPALALGNPSPNSTSKNRSGRDPLSTPVPVPLPINTNLFASSSSRNDGRRQSVSMRLTTPMSPPSSGSSAQSPRSTTAPVSYPFGNEQAPPSTPIISSPTSTVSAISTGMRRIKNEVSVRLGKELGDALDFVDGR